MKIVRHARSFLLRVRKHPVNRNGWEKRLLIVNLEALGDLIIFTSVLKHYQKRFPERKICLLIKSGTGAEAFLKHFVHEIITLDYRKFSVNPWYGASILRRLRGIGFKIIVNHDFSASEIWGKIITLELGAAETICYEGLGIEWRDPFDYQQQKNLEIVRRDLFQKYTKVIPGIDMHEKPSVRLPSAAEHYVAIYEFVSGSKENNYATSISFEGDAAATPKRFGLEKNKYAIFNVSASVTYKRWPLDRHLQIAEFLKSKEIQAVIVGANGDRRISAVFQKMTGALNLAGKTSLTELIALVSASCLVVTNDTSTVHMAVALRKPSLCITGGGQFGMFADYGYPDMNRWAYERTPCYFDNWRCGREVPPGDPSPCVAAITAENAMGKLQSLAGYLGHAESIPREQFSLGF